MQISNNKVSKMEVTERKFEFEFELVCKILKNFLPSLLLSERLFSYSYAKKPIKNCHKYLNNFGYNNNSFSEMYSSKEHEVKKINTEKPIFCLILTKVGATV